MKNFILILTGFLFTAECAYAVSPDCIALFRKNGIESFDKNCLSKCTTILVDMGSFMCPLECEDFCKDPCKDIIKKLEKNISILKPSNWPNKEKSSAWNKSEKMHVVESLSRIPEKLVNKSDFEIFKLDKSVNYPNPASNADGPKLLIAVYNSLFKGNYDLDTVLVHELAHQYYRKMGSDLQKNYRDSTNWFTSKSNDKIIIASRSTGFVKEDGKESPEEDFANNLEVYITDPTNLKKVYMPAFNWIEKNIGGLKMQKGCRYEK